MKLRTAILGAAALAWTIGPAQAQVSDDVVRVGVLNDQSGLYADNTGQGSVVAARMAAEDFGGKLLGKPIEIVFADHQNKADIGSNITRQWIDEGGVDAIADVGNSAVALAVQAITRDKGRVHLNTGAASSDLTGKDCSPTGFSWVYDTYALASGTGKALVKQGGDTWFFLSADYSFGQALERDTSKFIKEAGGKVLGSVRVPLNTNDFSSFLLQAQGSGAKVIGLANAGGDTINSIKQAAEFGIVKGGQRLAGLLVFLNDIHALGLETAQGLVITTPFYWDQNDETRAWTRRFVERHGKPASYIQAGTYSAVMHYLKAIAAAGTDDGRTVAAKMKALPVDDFMTKGAQVREDGRVMRDMYLVQVKSPAESKYPWDYYKILTTIPAAEAYRPLSEGNCPFVKKG